VNVKAAVEFGVLQLKLEQFPVSGNVFLALGPHAKPA
jgi:hypothetical protein